MSNFFPCPNPACTYQFDADQLPAAAMVTCPICRTRFPYRAAAPGASGSFTQVGQESGDSQSSFESRPPERMNRLINLRPAKKTNKAQTAMMLVGFTAVVLAVLTAITLSMNKKWFNEVDPEKPFVDQNFNFRWKIPPQPAWREDKMKLGGQLNAFLYKKQDGDSDPEAWIGFRCLALGGGNGIRGAREGELKDEAQMLLKNFSGLQQTAFKTSVAKQSVEGFQFDATFKDGISAEIPVMGEVCWFDYKGIGYIMLMWAPKENWVAAQKELVGVRDGFELATTRENWAATVDSTIHFSVENGDWELADTTGRWKKTNADLADADPKATMLLECKYPVPKAQRKDIIPKADAMVLDFSDGASSVQDVLKYLTNKDSELKFEPLEKQPSNQPIPKSDASIGTFLAKNSIDPNLNRYYAISVLKINNHNVAVVGWCLYKDAEKMDGYILGLVASLRKK